MWVWAKYVSAKFLFIGMLNKLITEWYICGTERVPLRGALVKENTRHCYGYVGLNDRRMVPLLRPGSLVLVDTEMRQIEDEAWTTEHDRPMYLVDVRDGYRCGWFARADGKLMMQPHPLSRCAPEIWNLPEQAEVIGKVIGVVTRLNVPWAVPIPESQEGSAGSRRKAL